MSSANINEIEFIISWIEDTVVDEPTTYVQLWFSAEAVG